MKCCKCDRQYPTNGQLTGIKLVKEDLGQTSTNDLLYKDYKNSNPFFLLCPWCFEEIFGGVKPYITRTSREVLESSPIPITTYTETSEVTIKPRDGNKIGDSDITPMVFVNGEMRQVR